ncbi:MAG: 4Fe-4S cluster-binding domain-containing protein [Phycisphaerae bacterium]|nr:4Fe-4S cluster-binding domain-containing protein [Phycisphaerae bacterium]
MLKLKDNGYNKNIPPDKPKLKLWTSAGLMLTYKCSAECRCCYYNCGPAKAGLMSVETAIAGWQGLINIAGENAKIHLTGGEPFLFYDRLCEILQKAVELRLGSVDMVETNGYWATDQNQIIQRLKFLDSHNVRRVKISYDPFHAEFVDFDRVKLLYETACRILGSDRVLLRWQKYIEDVPKLTGLSEEQKMNIFVESHEQYRCRFTGRAAGKLAQVLADKEIEQISANNCRRTFLDSKSIHIDPYGNVFNGVCSGIIIGNINQKSLDKIWQDFNPAKQEFLSVLFNSGPVGFLQKATELGYEKCRLYSGKCHLCTDLRRFFFDNNQYRPIINPKDCYF